MKSKKLLSTFLCLALTAVFCMSTANVEAAPKKTEEKKAESSFDIDLSGVKTTDDLEDQISDHVDACIESLNSRWEDLSKEVDTYDKYVKDAQKVSDFYDTIAKETEQICIMLREYTAAYADMVINDKDMDDDDKYDAMDDISDCIYEDACETVQKAIYDGLIEDMYDYYYDGIIDDACDTIEDYNEWYAVSSDEYSKNYDTSSAVYGTCYDTSSDIYSFCYDLGGCLYSSDIDRANKKLDKYIARTEKAKEKVNGEEKPASKDAKFDTKMKKVKKADEVEAVVEAQVAECIEALTYEWETLAKEIDTYDKYLDKVDEVEDFYEHVTEASSDILKMICEYGSQYSGLIVDSGISKKDMYDELEDVRYCVYDDACQEVRTDIYDGILKDMKAYIYDGVLRDSKKAADYSDWLDARSDAYSCWSDARGDVYSDWSDVRGEIYSFLSDLRSDVFSDKMDDAEKTIGKFDKKVAKM